MLQDIISSTGRVEFNFADFLIGAFYVLEGKRITLDIEIEATYNEQTESVWDRIGDSDLIGATSKLEGVTDFTWEVAERIADEINAETQENDFDLPIREFQTEWMTAIVQRVTGEFDPDGYGVVSNITIKPCSLIKVGHIDEVWEAINNQ